MAQRVKIDFKPGFRVTEEVMDALGILARDLIYQVISALSLRDENYGVIVNGLETDDIFSENKLFPSVSGNQVQVSPGICITHDKKFVVITDTLIVDLPPNGTWNLWLLVEEQRDTSIVVHDIEGNIDYPVYINSGWLQWYPPDMSPVYDGIKLGQLTRTGTQLGWTFNKFTRDIFVIVGSNLWIGDKDDNIVKFDSLIQPSVSPGVSLHRFLACKGSGIRTIKNPFALTFDDIQGEPFLIHNRYVFKAGVVFAEHGIMSNFLPDFQDRRYVPLYPKVKEAENKIIFCVSQVQVNDDIRYVCDDIYGSDKTNREGYVISGGYIRRYIKNYYVDDQPGKQLLVYVEYNSTDDLMEIKVAEYSEEFLNQLLYQNKLVIGKVYDGMIGREVEIWNYAYVIDAKNIRLSKNFGRLGSAGYLDFIVDRKTLEKYICADLETLIGNELVRRRGVRSKLVDYDYETLKGEFRIYDKTATLNTLTGHFNATDNSIQICVDTADNTLIKVLALTDGKPVWSFMNQWGFTAQFEQKKGSLTNDKVRFEDLGWSLQPVSWLNAWGLNIETTQNKAIILVNEIRVLTKQFGGEIFGGTETIYRPWFRVWNTGEAEGFQRLDLGWFWTSAGVPVWNGFIFQIGKAFGKWSIILDRLSVGSERKWYNIVQFERLENLTEEKKMIFNPSCDFDRTIILKDFNVRGVMSYIPQVKDTEQVTMSGNLGAPREWLVGDTKGYPVEYGIYYQGMFTDGNISEIIIDLYDFKENRVYAFSQSGLNLPTRLPYVCSFRKDGNLLTSLFISVSLAEDTYSNKLDKLSLVGFWYDFSTQQSGIHTMIISLPNYKYVGKNTFYTPYVSLIPSVNNRFIVLLPYIEMQAGGNMYLKCLRYIIDITTSGINVSEPYDFFLNDNPISYAGEFKTFILSFVEIHNDTELYLKLTGAHEVLFLMTLFYDETVNKRLIDYVVKLTNLTGEPPITYSICIEEVGFSSYPSSFPPLNFYILKSAKKYGKYVIGREYIYSEGGTTVVDEDRLRIWELNIHSERVNVVNKGFAWSGNFPTSLKKKYFSKRRILIGYGVQNRRIIYINETDNVNEIFTDYSQETFYPLFLYDDYIYALIYRDDTQVVFRKWIFDFE
jgi:hypothetical protein